MTEINRVLLEACLVAGISAAIIIGAPQLMAVRKIVLYGRPAEVATVGVCFGIGYTGASFGFELLRRVVN